MLIYEMKVRSFNARGRFVFSFMVADGPKEEMRQVNATGWGDDVIFSDGSGREEYSAEMRSQIEAIVRAVSKSMMDNSDNGKY